MAKIYNEIVIDMNPESSTFEETLYEDSFEYSGDMMLAQEIDYSKIYYVMGTDGKYYPFEYLAEADNPRWHGRGVAGITVEEIPAGYEIFHSRDSFDTAIHRSPNAPTADIEYVAPTLKKEDFFAADGTTQLAPEVITRRLQDAGAEGTYKDIYQQVIDFMPSVCFS